MMFKKKNCFFQGVECKKEKDVFKRACLRRRMVFEGVERNKEKDVLKR